MVLNIATLNRSGELGTIPNRNTRILQKDNYWYYSTREGVDIGPFDAQQDAEIGVGEFIDFICASEPNVLNILRQCRAV
jgi:hypothetical protein